MFEHTKILNNASIFTNVKKCSYTNVDTCSLKHYLHGFNNQIRIKSYQIHALLQKKTCLFSNKCENILLIYDIDLKDQHFQHFIFIHIRIKLFNGKNLSNYVVKEEIKFGS